MVSSYIIAAFVSVTGLILSGLFLESYKRHRDKQGVASAVAGEIFAILHMTKRRNHAEEFQKMLPDLKNGIDLEITNIIGTDTAKIDPVIEKYLDRLGLLGTESHLPERITTFYTYVAGIRIDLIRLSQEEFKGKPYNKATLIEEDLALWNESVVLGESVLNELRYVASKPWGIFKLFVRKKKAA